MIHDYLTRLTERPVDQVQAATGWYRLPGGRLELGSTGFVISFSSNPKQVPYHLHDPEGRCLSYGNMLQPMKLFAEQLAADRAEIWG